MIDKVKLYIPINTVEQRVVRDEIAKTLAKSYEAVILTFTEVLMDIDKKICLFPVSIVEVYVKEVTDEQLNFFKDLASVIAKSIGDSVVLEVTRESIYIGTAEA